MERFGPEFIRDNFLVDESEYNEDLRERLASAPVFEAAANYQREFLNTRLRKQDIIPAWNSVQTETLAILNEEAHEQDVTYENVSLRGEGIKLPRLEVDLVANIAMMSLLNEEKRQEQSFSQYFQQDEIRGQFYGFTMRFAETEDEDVFIPVLAYRVSLQKARTPNADITLFATGDVGATLLHFNKDARLDGAIEPLNKLYEACADKSESINSINVALAGTEMHDASIMRHVGYHADKIVKGVEDSKSLYVENAIIDLITNYLDKDSTYRVQAKKLTVLDGEKSEFSVYESEEAELYIQNKYLDVVFRDQIASKGAKARVQKQRTIQLAFAANADVAYVPLTQLHRFEKQ